MSAANYSSIFAPPGAFPPPPGFRAEAGFEEEDGYEPRGADSASSGLHGALLPTTLEPKVDGPPTHLACVNGSTVGVAFAAFGLSAPLRYALLKAFECGEEDAAEAIAETPDTEIEEILEEVLLDDNSRPPIRMEKGYVRNFFSESCGRASRLHWLPLIPRPRRGRLCSTCPTPRTGWSTVTILTRL